jgi:hypothetical protein
MLDVTSKEVGERRYLWHNKRQRYSTCCDYDCTRRHYITADSCGEVACEHEFSDTAWAFGKWIQQEAQQDRLLLAESNAIKRRRTRWS